MSESPVNLPETKEQPVAGKTDTKVLVLISKMYSTTNSRLFLAKRGDAKVVIKIPKPDEKDADATDKIVEGLINEYNVVQSIRKLNPNLAILFPLRDVKQTAIKVMGIEYPFCGGGDVFDLTTKTEGSLGEPRVRALLGPVAATLAWMHANRFAHRDVKPENILIDDAGRTLLADFAFSKQYSSKDSREFGGQGTIDYVAPEMLVSRDTGYNPFAADVWSLAITLLNVTSRSMAYDKVKGQLPLEPPLIHVF